MLVVSFFCFFFDGRLLALESLFAKSRDSMSGIMLSSSVLP